jgi:diaminohydroxyphosphoribosylaminopyrimidine deaminase/5-amino-6-(5-phosphoribosylamino)uracil reductase
MSVTDDIQLMKKVFRLAEKGTGNVSPNPLVGAVIVKHEAIIGSGFHAKYGQPHAEVQALNQARESVQGATLYCNLEPCAHTNKQTPPCVPAIINAGIRRVVLANVDPNQDVNGRGIAALQRAGLKVDTGVAETEGRELNRFYFKYISEKSPYVTLKYAQTIDGFIARDRNRQDWISAEMAQKKVHQLRARYDAVLIGAQTLRADNPQLTVRRVAGRDPLRIILSASLDLDPRQNIFNHPEPEKTWIFTTENANRAKMTAIANLGCRVIPLKSRPDNRFSIRDVLHVLADQRITSLLVEGGQQTLNAFLQTGLIDELKLIIAPIIWGRGLPLFVDPAETITKQYKLFRVERMNPDIMLTFRPD